MIATIDSIQFLLKQGLAFRGHDESRDSGNRGNFLKLLCFLTDHKEDINVVTFDNAPRNLQMTSNEIQKDIVSCGAVETTNIIIKEMGDVLFSIVIDESRDISTKEQMVVVLHYVDKSGYVVERFIVIEHVTSTTSISLKEVLDKLFSIHGLSMSRLRGQRYDGASNMQGEFNGLKTLILKDNKCAYFIHCFAHQFQLALISMAKKHEDVNSLFNLVAMLVNVVGASAKHHAILQEKHAQVVIKALDDGELSSGQGLNQEITLKRSVDTRWGSHYGTLLSIITMFPSIVDVLEIMSNEGNFEQRFQATMLLKCMQSFDFEFSLLLIKKILG
ncbi:TTF-type domain-containing protein [Citrus sinensis]|uniref:TTF-type domain-containing protein n=2 Tax=Citrus sinensis TaxID=2711 RepID=A0ACB8IDS6_CITSI|nr:TTF-type domain-containing protein [Citrus sinensis]